MSVGSHFFLFYSIFWHWIVKESYTRNAGESNKDYEVCVCIYSEEQGSKSNHGVTRFLSSSFPLFEGKKVGMILSHEYQTSGQSVSKTAGEEKKRRERKWKGREEESWGLRHQKEVIAKSTAATITERDYSIEFSLLHLFQREKKGKKSDSV